MSTLGAYCPLVIVRLTNRQRLSCLEEHRGYWYSPQNSHVEIHVTEKRKSIVMENKKRVQ